MTRKEMDRYLPGEPSGLLVRKVRRHLKGYGIVPQIQYWRLTWEWASKICQSYVAMDSLLDGHFRRKRWASPSEIGAQYLALMLSDMRDNFALKLPHRAADVKHMPLAVSVALSTSMPQLALN